jgi:hypothetical protein
VIVNNITYISGKMNRAVNAILLTLTKNLFVLVKNKAFRPGI